MPKPAPEHGLLGGRVRLREAPEGLRATTDTVLLAAAVPAATGNLVLDLGSGVGAAALCLAWRVPGCRVIGVDSDAALIRLARRNARANGVADRVRFRVGAVAGRWPADLGSGCADHVMTNPPFLAPARAAAR
ncbi:MAG: methyltransferase, partial [Alphaproteobacteria bacterium]